MSSLLVNQPNQTQRFNLIDRCPSKISQLISIKHLQILNFYITRVERCRNGEKNLKLFYLSSHLCVVLANHWLHPIKLDSQPHRSQLSPSKIEQLISIERSSKTLNISTTLPNKPLASFPINHSTQILSPLPNLKRSHSRQQTNFQSQSSKRRIPPPANFHLHAPNSRLFTRKQRGYNENVIVVCIMQRFPECRVHGGDIPGIRWSITRTGTNRGPFSVGRS